MNSFSKLILSVAITVVAATSFSGCTQPKTNLTRQTAGVIHPDWSKNANIYEVNIRQYTEEGTFDAFRKHLPRLEKMGVEILWLMPIHPIGEKNRKGSLGSYYSVKNYKAVNPNYGTLQDLKELIDEAHRRGMKVILDWVANHTAWDHHWTKEHPEWYTKNEEGEFKPPVPAWSDVIELDYSKHGLRDAMIEVMKYWVKVADINGYRCDVAAAVPVEFWERAIKELNQIKPVFMLAEADDPALHDAGFDMTYGWDFHFLLNKVARREKPLAAIDSMMQVIQKKYDENDYLMMFTSNHDENSWKGTVYERMGENYKVAAVLMATIKGMPLIYSGQEAGLDKRLKFFEKDVISWDKLPLQDFYSTLLHLKTENEALWNGKFGGKFVKVENNMPKDIYSYKRVKGEHEVLVALNFSDQDLEVSLLGLETLVDYTNVFTGQQVTISGEPVSIKAHGYLVLAKSENSTN